MFFPFSFSSCLYSFPNMSMYDTSKVTMKESWNFAGSSSKSSIDCRLLATTYAQNTDHEKNNPPGKKTNRQTDRRLLIATLGG